MNKTFTLLLIGAILMSMSYFLMSSTPSNQIAEEAIKPELEQWRLKLHQDSTIYQMVFNDEARKGDIFPVLERGYNDYMFDLFKDMEYDRAIIKELEEKQ